MTTNVHAETLRIASFDPDQTEVRWQIVNDTVMGGRSASRFAIDAGQLEFSGTLNTNGGGFASLRSNRQDWDLAAYSAVRLKVRGDGRAYRFRLFPDETRESYQSQFETVAGEWLVVELPFEGFYASLRGRRLNRPAVNPADIVGVGLILADGFDGNFSLTLDWLEFGETSAASDLP